MSELHDLDELLAVAAMREHPPAAFEEALLARLEDEVDLATAELADVVSSTRPEGQSRGEPLLTIAPEPVGNDANRRRWSRSTLGPLLAAAAAIVVAALVWNQGTDTPGDPVTTSVEDDTDQDPVGPTPTVRLPTSTAPLLPDLAAVVTDVCSTFPPQIIDFREARRLKYQLPVLLSFSELMGESLAEVLAAMPRTELDRAPQAVTNVADELALLEQDANATRAQLEVGAARAREVPNLDEAERFITHLQTLASLGFGVCPDA